MVERVTLPVTELFRALQDGATVLTGNARLSRSLRAGYDRAQWEAGHQAWASPAVLPWTAWLKQSWEGVALSGDVDAPRLLSPEQEAALWAQVLNQDTENLLRPAATARALARSFALLKEYRLDLDDPAFGFGEDATAFRRWARSFERLCAARSCVSGAGLVDLLAASNTCPAANNLLLLGFYELSPAQIMLLDRLATEQTRVRWVSLAGQQSAPRRVQARDPDHELRLVARWVRQRLERAPEARLGIVVPELSAARAPLTRYLADALDPALLQPDAAARARPWNFSLGEALSAYPIIDTALNLLALTRREIPLETVGALLASPWWAMPEDAEEHLAESSRRALLDARLREQHGVPGISPRNLLFYATQEDENGAPRPWAAPRIGRRLRRLAQSLERLPGRAGAAEWALYFSKWLQEAGWRNGSRLDSTSFQAVEKWQELLTTFSSLDDFEGAMRLEGALSLIRRLAGETVFQPQAPEAQVPVQVLGLLEANEQRFDALWVLGLHDGRWPQPLNHDPFLPLALQRRHGLPGCDPARELERARQITAQLAGAADAVLFSHPAADGDEQLRPSPLIRAYPEISTDEASGPAGLVWRDLARDSATLESMAPQVPIPFPGGRARGGTQVIRHQAVCPFRAFAEHRLGASPLAAPALGLDAAERGSLVHKVLEHFWRQTSGWQELVSLAEDALRDRVETAVSAAIAERSRQLEWQPQLSAIERERLGRQVLGWLALERQRAPFDVLHREYPVTLTFGALQIDTKIDRIDALPDGRVLIIDYKTGKVSPSAWFGERPDDPQLPIYTCAEWSQPVAGVVFGVVKADELKFSGVVAEAELLPGLPARGRSEAAMATESWPAVLEDWSRTCRVLAKDFCTGHATVDPKNGVRTCESSYCTLQPLCRIPTASDLGTPSDTAEDAE